MALWSLLCLLASLLTGGAGATPATIGAPASALVFAAGTAGMWNACMLSSAALSETSTEISPAPRRQVAVWATYAGQTEQQTLTEYSDVIDEVNFSGYTLGAGGRIGGAIASAAARQAARDAGLRVVPSIANQDFRRDVVLDAIGTPEARQAHVKALIALVEENGFDGIDIDYESLAAEDRDLFSPFIEELGAALHARGRLLSIAVHAKTDDAGTWGGPAAQDWVRLGAAVDEFKIMTYDYHWSTSEAGPIAPLDWVDAVLTYAATVVPPQKTWMGVHFYGYDWVGSAAESLEWRQVVARAERSGAVIRRDEPGEAWFTYTSGGGASGEHTVYFSDSRALAERLAFIVARHPDLTGIAIWRLGGEDPGNWEALR